MKRHDALWHLSVTTSQEAEEAVSELVGRFFDQPVSSHTDLERGLTTVSIYFEQKPEWTGRLRERLRGELHELERHGLSLGPASIRLRAMRRENWAESWKRHFHPLEIRGALLIKPSWSRRKARKGQGTIVLDPD